MVVLIGRRRRATYGRVKIHKSSKVSCTISENLASNLRLRQDDKVKVVSLSDADRGEARSGDLVLVDVAQPPAVQSVTFSPIDDSLAALVSAEGGDEIPEDELLERFIAPYTENRDTALIKQGLVLTLRDDNGKKLDFLVSHVLLAGEEEKEDEGKSMEFVVQMHFFNAFAGCVAQTQL